jgi:hypothetical protein
MAPAPFIPEATLPGPSRTITVEPLEVPLVAPPPSEPSRPSHAPEPAPEPVREPTPVREPAPSR